MGSNNVSQELVASVLGHAGMLSIGHDHTNAFGTTYEYQTKILYTYVLSLAICGNYANQLAVYVHMRSPKCICMIMAKLKYCIHIFSV